MTNKISYILFSLLLIADFSFAQDILAHNVPSSIRSEFQKAFPNAKDVEWGQKGNRFEAEFEVGWLGYDHEILYDSVGNVVKHKAEISKRELPSKVSDKLKKDFKWYWIKDVKRIVENQDTVYLMEAQSVFQEYELALNADGVILDKLRD